MIIHPPSISAADEEIQASARIEMRAASGELWFRFRAPAGLTPSRDIDPFVVALLLVAMQNQENIEIRGTLSRRLFAGLQEYQKIYHSWFPERFHLVELRPEGLRDDPAPESDSQGAASACAFSGGVDSFYTLLALLGRAEERETEEHAIAPAPLTHALFMAGFDMPLNLTQSIQSLVRAYSRMMEDMGIAFVTGRTNVRAFVNSVDWTNAHGQALAASALFFKKDWKRFFVPASYTGASYPKWGTHPALDPLLSTESLEFIHHGSHANRVKKLAAIAQAPESYDRLRVCWIQDIGLKNCGHCEKCIRTMIALDLLGALPRYSTFESGGLARNRIRALPHRTHQGRVFARELVYEAVRRRKFGISFDLAYSLLKREARYRNPFA